MAKKINLPLTDELVAELHTGDNLLLSGVIYAARDAAHKRITKSLESNQPLPFDLKGQTVYYMGPTPAKPGQPMGAAGPTTSGRMDIYTPCLLDAGLKGMIGKGMRSQAVKDAMMKHKAIYMAAVGGAAALLSKRIRRSEVVAYAELGAEAVLRLYVEDFPVIVVNDVYGNDLYQEGKAKYGMADE